jgi:N-methylhydantoinase B/oxoprolinase/acetone carboxylase alpha subunit
MREVIEDTRRSFKATVRRVTVPGRYRAPAFIDVELADKEASPAAARRDLMMHGCYEMRFGEDGTMEVDLDGSSAWGWHSMNATPAHPGDDVARPHADADLQRQDQRRRLPGHVRQLPRRHVGQQGRRDLLVLDPLAAAVRDLHRVPARPVARAAVTRVHRGGDDLLPDVGGAAGGGIDQYGNLSGFMNFEFAGGGMGAKYVLDGLDYGAAPFNPEGDHGDCEMWS